MFIRLFSISFACLVVILLILCVIPLWDSPFLSGRCPFSRALHLGIQLSLYPASSRFGTQQQLTHPPVKSSTLSLRKMSVFQGVAHRQTNFILSCVIPLWESARAHSPSGKDLILSSLEKSCFSGLIVLLMFSHYPAWAHFGLLHTHIFH